MSDTNFIIIDGNFDDWKCIVDEICPNERWCMGYDDYGRRVTALGNNFKFIVAKLKDTNQVIGSGCLVKFGDNTAMIGTYYIFSAYRGTGIGSQLFDKLIKDSQDENRNIGLYGADTMVKKYADRYGLGNIANWILKSMSVMSPNIDRLIEMNTNSKISTVDINPIEMEAQLLEYDQQILIDVNRRDYIREWVLSTHINGWAKIAIDNDSIVGYGCARIICDNRLMIGPLYADNQSTAIALLYALLKNDTHLSTREVAFYIPSSNVQMFEMLQQMGTPICNSISIGQFTHRVPTIRLDKLYATVDTICVC